MQGRRLGNWIKQRQDQTIDYTEPQTPEEEQAGEAWEIDPEVLRIQRRQRVRWTLITVIALLLVGTGAFLLIHSATGYQRLVRSTFGKSISFIEYQPFANAAFINVDDPSLFNAIRDWFAEAEPQDSLTKLGTATCQLKVVYADGTSKTIMIDPTGPSLGPEDTLVPPNTMVPIEVDGFKRWAYAATFHNFVYARLPADRQLAKDTLPKTAFIPGRAFAAVLGTPAVAQDEVSPYDGAMDLAKQLVQTESYGQALLALREALRFMPESVEAADLSAIMRSNLQYQAPRLRAQLTAVLNESTDRFGTRAGYRQVRADLLKVAWMFPPDDAEIGRLRGRLATRRPRAEIAKFREVWRLEGGAADLYPVRSLLWSPDGTRIAAACTDPLIRIWDGTNGRLLARMPVAGAFESLAFSADGRFLLAGGHDVTEISRASQVWDTVTCEPATTERDQPTAPASFFHPDGIIATTTPDGDVELRDSKTQQVLKVLGGHVGLVRLARFSADGDVLLTLGEDGTAIGWGDGPVDESRPVEENRYRSLRRLATLPGPGVFTNDGKIILVPREGMSVDGTLGASLALMPVDLKDSIQEMTVSADGKLLVVETEAGEAVVADVEKGMERQRYRPPEGSSRGVGVSPNGKQVAYGAGDGSVRVVDVASGSEVVLTSSLTGRKWSSIRFSGDGRLVLARDGEACAVWEVSSATNWFRTDRLSSGEAEARPAVLSGDGKLLAVARQGNAFEIIGTDTFDGSVRVQRNAVTSLSFSGDGRMLAAADAGGVITIHDTSSGGAMQTMRVVGAGSGDGAGVVRGMLFGPDGNTLLVDAGDRSVRLFDVTRGAELRRLALPEGVGRARPMSFGPDSKRVVVGEMMWGVRE